MNKQIAAGATLVASHPIINTAANAIGVAKTGTAIGTLHGAAHTSATAAWIGLGSMKAGMFLMGALPVVGVLLILEGISGREQGSPIIDWYEEAWRQYEAQCELEELKKEVEVDVDHQLRVKRQAATLAHQEVQFRALEVEHDLYLMKKEIGFEQKQPDDKGQKLGKSVLTEIDYSSFNVLDTPNVGLKVKENTTGIIGFIVSEFFHTKSYRHRTYAEALDMGRGNFQFIDKVGAFSCSIKYSDNNPLLCR
ncbi:hypothetical protein IFO70_27120 [Phormidium tenue FACHB-886]|nr:hypothetical protein [Phormidium tenue FACHB-886]